MEIEHARGFVLVRKGGGPVYVALHSGPQFGYTITRDTGSDTAASLAWEKTGGSLVLSAMPREQVVGVDANREAPSREEAARMYEKDGKGVGKYRDRFAWVAVNKADHERRLEMYEEFWSRVRELGRVFVLVHTMDSRMASFPSLLDIITLDGKGISMEKARELRRMLSRKYAGFLGEVEKSYKDVILLEHRISAGKDFPLTPEFMLREFFRRDMNIISKYAEPGLVEKVKSWRGEDFVKAVESALERGGKPEITIEHVFSGKRAGGPKKWLEGSMGSVVEVELNKFLSVNYPEVASDMIADIAKALG